MYFLLLLQIQSVFKISKNASNKEKFSKNIVSGGCAGSLSLLFVQSIDYTRTRLATGMYKSCLYLIDKIYSNVFNFTQLHILNFTPTDAKSSTGKRQFNGIVDVYVKTVQSDGVRGLYRGFAVSCVCIFIYRGLYFGLYDTLKPLVLGENAKWIQTFLLGWGVTITAGLVIFFENLYRIVLSSKMIILPYSF